MFTTRLRTATGFSTRAKKGFYGHKRTVAAGTVSAALTANGQALSLDPAIETY